VLALVDVQFYASATTAQSRDVRQPTAHDPTGVVDDLHRNKSLPFPLRAS
jgi:hypothetical protein